MTGIGLEPILPEPLGLFVLLAIGVTKLVPLKNRIFGLREWISGLTLQVNPLTLLHEVEHLSQICYVEFHWFLSSFL